MNPIYNNIVVVVVGGDGDGWSVIWLLVICIRKAFLKPTMSFE